MKKPRIFYGYWILTACFLLNIIGAGCGPISFSFFVTSLEKALDWSRTEIMAAFTLFFICSAMSAPFAGRLVHGFGGRKVVTLGAISACIGFVLISQMHELWQYYIGYALIGFGISAMGPVITTLLVANWFRKRRGMAIGIMSMGAGIAAMIFTPLIIVHLLPNFGWSVSYITFAVITGGVGIPLGIFVIRTEPTDMGLLPDGKDASEIDNISEAGKPSLEGLTFRSALGTRAFWLLAIAIMFIYTHMGIIQNQIPHLEDLRFSPGIVASTMTIVAVMSAAGTLLFGWLCDRIPVKTANIIGLVLTAMGIAILMNINESSAVWVIWTYAAIMGLGFGGLMPGMAMLTSVNFGMVAYGTIYGMLHFFQSIGAATGPILAGYIYDTRGGYFWAFIIIVVLVVAAMPLVLAIRRPASYYIPGMKG